MASSAGLWVAVPAFPHCLLQSLSRSGRLKILTVFFLILIIIIIITSLLFLLLLCVCVCSLRSLCALFSETPSMLASPGVPLARCIHDIAHPTFHVSTSDFPGSGLSCEIDTLGSGMPSALPPFISIRLPPLLPPFIRFLVSLFFIFYYFIFKFRMPFNFSTLSNSLKVFNTYL